MTDVVIPRMLELGDIVRLRDWSIKNVAEGGWQFTDGRNSPYVTWTFKNETDALMFELRWK